MLSAIHNMIGKLSGILHSPMLSLVAYVSSHYNLTVCLPFPQYNPRCSEVSKGEVKKSQDGIITM